MREGNFKDDEAPKATPATPQVTPATPASPKVWDYQLTNFQGSYKFPSVNLLSRDYFDKNYSFWLNKLSRTHKSYKCFLADEKIF